MNGEKRILYYGTPRQTITPVFGSGLTCHDFGPGFYLTENSELAKEWAVCRPDQKDGFVHAYELNLSGLKVLDLCSMGVLTWTAELIRHRDASDSRRYRMLAEKFLELYGIDTSGYDVIRGWRADASFFYPVRQFLQDNVDLKPMPLR